MRWWGWWRFGAAFGMLLVALAAVEARSEDGSDAGMRAYVDPSGRLVPAPPPGTAVPPAAALERSGAGLTETPAPGGGRMIDLKGRFRSPVVATVQPDGSVRIDHDHATDAH